MQLIAPDLLEPILGLSVVVCAVGIAVGFLLWLLGWSGHRFWIVLFTTVAAGLIGLMSGKSAGVTPLVAGVLLAVSAGMMALALARLVAFTAGGVAVCLLMQFLLPAWDDPLLFFLGGGLAGLVLFRLWMMVLTSLAGTLLMGYSILCLLDKLGKLHALAWAGERVLLLNWACAGLTLLGLVVQLFLDRWQRHRKRLQDEQAHLKKAQQEVEQRMRQHKNKTWWKWGQPPQRKAA